MKTCSKCGEEKPLDDFPIEKRVKDGRCARCFSCRRAAHKAYRERTKEQTKKHYEENKEAILAKQKAYYEKNKAIISKRQKQYREKNKDKILESQREWRANMSPAEREAHLEKKKKYYASLSEEKKAAIRQASSERYLSNRDHHLAVCRKWVEKNRDKSASYKKKYRERHPDKVKAQQDDYHRRNKDKISAKAKAHRAENRDLLKARAKARYYENHEQEVLNRRRWRKSNTDRLSDGYIRALLTDKKTLGVMNPPQELIELKRVQLKIHRHLAKGATK